MTYFFISQLSILKTYSKTGRNLVITNDNKLSEEIMDSFVKQEKESNKIGMDKKKIIFCIDIVESWIFKDIAGFTTYLPLFL